MLEGVEDEYNMVWRAVQYDDETLDSPGCMWELDANVQDRLAREPSSAPIFFPFLDPFAAAGNPRELMLLTETAWNILRGTVKNKKPPNWPRMSRDRRNLRVTLPDGRAGWFQKFQTRTPLIGGKNDSSAFWVDTFDAQFSKAQVEAEVIAGQLGTDWKLVEGIPWREKVDGSWARGGDDHRKFADNLDGFGFQRNGWGGAPQAVDARYVKLDPSDAGKLLLGDPQAWYRGVSPDQVFIMDDIMRMLCAGLYPFEQYGYAVSLRNAAGEVGYVQCDNRTVVREFWKDAYDHSLITKTGWKLARWRNVANLDLCFVVAGASTTVDELQQAVNQARADAIVPIKQTAIVVDGRANKPNEFGHLVSVDRGTVLGKDVRMAMINELKIGSSARPPSATMRHGLKRMITYRTTKPTPDITSQAIVGWGG